MSELSSEMASVLEQVAKEFETAEVFNNWMPPDGVYTALVSGYHDGVSVKGTAKTAWWKLDGRLIHPSDTELDGKEFTLGLFRSSQVGFLKGVMAILAGRKVDDIRQASSILSGACGWVVTVKVTTRPSGKVGDDREFTNATITGVVQRNPQQA